MTGDHDDGQILVGAVRSRAHKTGKLQPVQIAQHVVDKGKVRIDVAHRFEGVGRVAHFHDRAHAKPLQVGSQDGRHVRVVLDDENTDAVETAGHEISQWRKGIRSPPDSAHACLNQVLTVLESRGDSLPHPPAPAPGSQNGASVLVLPRCVAFNLAA